ncbi:MAG: hypothetical protein NC089_10855 [Bacteroides sp.]|nr:hypothetical protein [Bacteroides sp.]MCM1551032.1 hypothetical protein [Clostridium sp.]
MEKNGKTKIIALIVGVILIVIAGYVVVKMNQISNLSIGKVVDIDFQDGNADYLEMLLEPENGKDVNNKLILLDRNAVEQLIQYMRDNDVRIVSGEYKIPQTSNYEEIIKILEFEPNNK